MAVVSLIGLAIPCAEMADGRSAVAATGARRGIAADTSFLQVWTRTPTNGLTLGSFSVLTVLDSAF